MLVEYGYAAREVRLLSGEDPDWQVWYRLTDKGAHSAKVVVDLARTLSDSVRL